MITFSQLGALGRRGNQMFQAAAVIALAKRYNNDYSFPICELMGSTNIPANKFANDIKLCSSYQEPFFHFQELPNIRDLNVINSYLQSYKYFEDFKDEICYLMRSNLFYPEYNNHTSIHIRRTDYVNLKDFHSNLDMNYYNDAMNLIQSDKYIILSDDINWCKQYFKGNEFTFIEGNSPQIDQAIMYSCKNNIIANSSFSWWGAYLNINLDKKIVAPSNWFGPKLQHNIKDLIPQNWNVI